MRMRRKKHREERLSACAEYLFTTPEAPISGDDLLFFEGAKKVFLEVGCGKGGFSCKMAERHSDACYYAMERATDCLVLAAESAKKCEISNLKFINDNADNLEKIFAPESIDEMFLNFSDPWPKKGYAKRRLTHRRYLEMYMRLLKSGGVLTFKTDNDGLFDFSLEEVEALGLELVAMTRDLHASEYNEGNIMTEYETAFSEKGKNINMLRIKKHKAF
jgi:tRNA (guanine-N7-)-methyltransferase